MQNPPVHWSEGMFLRPHHFQAADRHWNELAGLHSKMDHPYGYGVFHFGCSEESIANGMLEIVGLKLRLRDGTVVALEPNEVLKADLGTRLEAVRSSTGAIRVFLALPEVAEGRSNVSKGADSRVRYLGLTREVDDDSRGNVRQEVGLKKLQCQIRFSHEDMSGFDTLPLFQLIRNPAGQYRIDPSYFPPMISVQSWPEMADLLRNIWHFIGNRIRSLGSIVRETHVNLSSQVEGDMQKMLLMHAMNESYGELSCIAHASGVHPLVAYTTLCAIVGRLSIFGEKIAIDVDDLPLYDHDNLQEIFRWAERRIRELINSVKEDECIQRPFKGAGKGMRVTLEPEWFDPEWEWYFGCQPINVTVDEIIPLFRKGTPNAIDWKLGSWDKVEEYLKQSIPCLDIGIIKQLPRALSNKRKWAFFKIRQEGEPWDSVRNSQTMGFRIPTHHIRNLESLNDSEKLHIAQHGKSYSMTFAIFAVKKRV